MNQASPNRENEFVGYNDLDTLYFVMSSLNTSCNGERGCDQLPLGFFAGCDDSVNDALITASSTSDTTFFKSAFDSLMESHEDKYTEDELAQIIHEDIIRRGEFLLPSGGFPDFKERKVYDEVAVNGYQFLYKLTTHVTLRDKVRQLNLLADSYFTERSKEAKKTAEDLLVDEILSVLEGKDEMFRDDTVFKNRPSDGFSLSFKRKPRIHTELRQRLFILSPPNGVFRKYFTAKPNFADFKLDATEDPDETVDENEAPLVGEILSVLKGKNKMFPDDTVFENGPSKTFAGPFKNKPKQHVAIRQRVFILSPPNGVFRKYFTAKPNFADFKLGATSDDEDVKATQKVQVDTPATPALTTLLTGLKKRKERAEVEDELSVRAKSRSFPSIRSSAEDPIILDAAPFPQPLPPQREGVPPKSSSKSTSAKGSMGWCIYMKMTKSHNIPQGAVPLFLHGSIGLSFEDAVRVATDRYPRGAIYTDKAFQRIPWEHCLKSVSGSPTLRQRFAKEIDARNYTASI
jgi:hypothetical protein